MPCHPPSTERQLDDELYEPIQDTFCRLMEAACHRTSPETQAEEISEETTALLIASGYLPELVSTRSHHEYLRHSTQSSSSTLPGILSYVPNGRPDIYTGGSFTPEEYANGSPSGFAGGQPASLALGYANYQDTRAQEELTPVPQPQNYARLNSNIPAYFSSMPTQVPNVYREFPPTSTRPDPHVQSCGHAIEADFQPHINQSDPLSLDQARQRPPLNSMTAGNQLHQQPDTSDGTLLDGHEFTFNYEPNGHQLAMTPGPLVGVHNKERQASLSHTTIPPNIKLNVRLPKQEPRPPLVDVTSASNESTLVPDHHQRQNKRRLECDQASAPKRHQKDTNGISIREAKEKSPDLRNCEATTVQLFIDLAAQFNLPTEEIVPKRLVPEGATAACQWRDSRTSAICGMQVGGARHQQREHLRQVHGLDGSRKRTFCRWEAEGVRCDPRVKKDKDGKATSRKLLTGSLAKHISESHLGYTSVRCRICETTFTKISTALRHLTGCLHKHTSEGVQVVEK